MDNQCFRKLASSEKCGNVLSNKIHRKCLTKGTGSENLRRAIDEYFERFEREGKEKINCGVTK